MKTLAQRAAAIGAAATLLLGGGSAFATPTTWEAPEYCSEGFGCRTVATADGGTLQVPFDFNIGEAGGPSNSWSKNESTTFATHGSTQMVRATLCNTGGGTGEFSIYEDVWGLADYWTLGDDDEFADRKKDFVWKFSGKGCHIWEFSPNAEQGAAGNDVQGLYFKAVSGTQSGWYYRFENMDKGGAGTSVLPMRNLPDDWFIPSKWGTDASADWIAEGRTWESSRFLFWGKGEGTSKTRLAVCNMNATASIDFEVMIDYEGAFDEYWHGGETMDDWGWTVGKQMKLAPRTCDEYRMWPPASLSILGLWKAESNGIYIHLKDVGSGFPGSVAYRWWII